MYIDSPNISGSLTISGSLILNGTPVTASGGSGTGAGFPFSGSAVITGSLYVSGGNISGSFVGDGAGITGVTIDQFATFEDTFTNAPSHSAVHNFGTKNVFVQVFESDDTLLIPYSVTTTTANQVDIVFGDTLSGRVVIGKAGHILQDTGNFVSSSTAVQTFTNATTASINHYLDSFNVITQVFDSNNNVIVPSNIKVATKDRVDLTFASSRSGKVVIAKAGHIVSGSGLTTIASNLEPAADETYDLGSPTKKWKDLYLSGSTIHLGSTKISEKAGGGLSITNASGSEVTSGIAERVRAGSSGSRDLTTPQSGSLWFNTNTATLEVYSGASGSGWTQVGGVTSTPITATGGEITTFGAYTVHTFTSSADFVIDIGDTEGEVEYLIVAGGGAGGCGRHSGAGGAGGMLTGSTTLSNGTYTFTVGAGGTSSRTSPPSTNGQDTTALGLTAIGGGKGGDHGVTPLDESAGNGGSGGSAAHTAGLAAGSGTAGQGNDGSRAVPDRSLGPSGGGAGGKGVSNGTGSETTSTGAADDGGPGLQSNIDGNNYYYAGGGGGGASPQSPSYLGNWSGGDGGIGGGGGGASSTNAGSGGAGGGSARNSGVDGVATQTQYACHGGAGGANTGGGGGGAAGWSSVGNGDGGNGGSGIVIVRYLT